MSNQIALVTGASSGIGRCVAFELSKVGFEVIISSRNIAGLNETKNLIDNAGGKAHVIQMDISDYKSVKNLFIKSKDIGFVDLVVSNAGIAKFDKIQNIDIEDWDSQLSVNLRGSFLIDEKGNVRHEIKNDLPLGRNIDEMLRLIDALDHHNKHGEVCPAGWTEGKAGMKPSDSGMRDFLSNNTEEL